MPRRLAVLVTGAVAKMQASRIVTKSSERIFTDEQEAKNRLFSPDEAG